MPTFQVSGRLPGCSTRATASGPPCGDGSRSSGYGRSGTCWRTARAASKLHTVLLDVNDTDGKAVADELGGHYLHCDVSDFDDVVATTAEAEKAFEEEIRLFPDNAFAYKNLIVFYAVLIWLAAAALPVPLAIGLVAGFTFDHGFVFHDRDAAKISLECFVANGGLHFLKVQHCRGRLKFAACHDPFTAWIDIHPMR